LLDILSDVTRNLVVLIIVATLLEMLLPRNDFRPFVNMVVGLVLMLVLLAPIRMLLRLPAEMEPAVFRAVGVADADIADRERMLEQLNWNLVLSRYHELLEARITAVLHEEEMSLAGLQLDIIDDPAHLEFGRPRQVTVLAQSGVSTKGLVKPVEPVRIGGSAEISVVEQGEEDRRLARKLAAALGVSEENVSVQVLN
jgi:stage III sporulation protein AF